MIRWCNEVEIIYEYIAPRNWVLYSVRLKGKGRESRPKGRNLVVNLDYPHLKPRQLYFCEGELITSPSSVVSR